MFYRNEITYSVWVIDPNENIHTGKNNLSWEQAREERDRLKEEWNSFIKNFNWKVEIHGEVCVPM